MTKPAAALPTPKRVVVYRLGSLGDTVVALPALHRVAASFPEAERVVLTNFPVMSKAAPLEAILGGSGLVHGYLAYPVSIRSVGALLDLRQRLRALGADTLVYLTPARGLRAAWRDLVFFKLCGFRQVIGAPLTADLQRHRRGADGALERESERLARCVAPLGALALDDPAMWNLHLSAAEQQAAAERLAPVAGRARIAINMGTKFAQNDWGEARWTAFARRLAEVMPDVALIFIGATEDVERAARVGAAFGGAVVDLCGQVSPRVSAAAMVGSKAFVGHDSGPLHLAASVGVTCVGLYSDKHAPRQWHPWGAQHRILHEMRGLQAIEVERVIEALRGVVGDVRADPSAGPAPAAASP